MRKLLIISAWVLYDLANQFFALNVVSLYFVRWLTIERQAPEFFYSLSYGISNLFIACLAPLLGSVSDATGRRRVHLVWLTLLSIIFTLALGLHKSILLNLLFFAVANFGCQTATVFYNAMMVDVAPQRHMGLLSGIGKAVGYVGAILALYLVKPMVLKSGYQAAFFPSGLLFLIFALPCLVFVKDRNTRETKINLADFLKRDKFLQAFIALKKTAVDISRYPGIADFLKASFFSLCAVNTVIIFMSVYITKAFTLNEEQIINLIGFSTLFAIGGSFLSGYLSDYIGSRRSLILVMSLWSLCFFLGATATKAYLYWVVGALFGITLGSTWVVSRALAIELVPKEKTGEIFGLFNLVGYLSAVVGALFWGLILKIFYPLGALSYRIALFSLIFFMLLGVVYLLRLPKNA